MKSLLLAVLLCPLALTPTLADCDKVTFGNPNELLIRFEKGADVAAAEKSEKAKKVKTIKMKGYPGSEAYDLEHWSFANRDERDRAMKSLKKRKDVTFVEADEWTMTPHVMPNDPWAAQWQWFLKVPTTDPTYCSVQDGSMDIDLEHAWDIRTQGAMVAEWDAGDVDATHPDIGPVCWTNPGDSTFDGIDNEGDGKIDDVHGWNYAKNRSTCNPATAGNTSYHPSMVFATITGGNNGIDGSGVGWGTPVLVGVPSGESTYATFLDYAVSKGARVVTMSWGASFSQVLKDAICAHQNDLIFTISAGNDNHDLDLPGTDQWPAEYDCPNIIAVGATTCLGDNPYFNYGKTAVDVAAPGANIVTDSGPLSPGPCLPGGRATTGCAVKCDLCSLPTCTPTDPGNGCGDVIVASGTSFSTPITAGVLSLGFAEWPQMTPATAKSLLLSTCDPTMFWKAAPLNQNVCGGKINAFRFLQAVQAAKPVSMYPNSDKSPNGYVAVPSGAHWSTIDEVTQNGDTDYLKVYTGQSESYGLDVSGLSDSVSYQSVTINWTVKNGSVDDAIEHVGIKVGSQDYWAADRYIYHGTGYQDYADTLTAAQMGGSITKSILSTASLRHAPVSQGALPRPQLTRIMAVATP